MRARQQKANYELTLGAALGAALRSGCRVRQGGIGPTPCRHGGVILDDDHRGLRSLCRSLGQRPEKAWIQIEASQIQDKSNKN